MSTRRLATFAIRRSFLFRFFFFSLLSGPPLENESPRTNRFRTTFLARHKRRLPRHLSERSYWVSLRLIGVLPSEPLHRRLAAVATQKTPLSVSVRFFVLRRRLGCVERFFVPPQDSSWISLKNGGTKKKADPNERFQQEADSNELQRRAEAKKWSHHQNRYDAIRVLESSIKATNMRRQSFQPIEQREKSRVATPSARSFIGDDGPAQWPPD